MKTTWLIHFVLITLVLLTLVPFGFAVNTAFRTNAEFYQAFFAFPESLKALLRLSADALTGQTRTYVITKASGQEEEVDREEALIHCVDSLTKGIRMAWRVIRPYMFNTFFVCALTALGVVLLGSGTGYVLARYKFLGKQTVFIFVISTMMFPGVLTLVPSFLLVRRLGLLNTYWAMILPFVATGQVFAIFVFKSFFEGLSEDLFESARIDGAGHFRLYWNIVIPLSKPVFSVVLVMNVLGTWNNFLWPFIVNPEGKNHLVASGLFVLANSAYASNFATMYAGYALSSIPLLILLILATKPFIRGIASGAFKA